MVYTRLQYHSISRTQRVYLDLFRDIYFNAPQLIDEALESIEINQGKVVHRDA